MTCLRLKTASSHYHLYSNALNCVCGAAQAGGYFSLCVCLTTWWLAIAELVFDVTGKVSLLSLQRLLVLWMYIHHAAGSCTTLVAAS